MRVLGAIIIVSLSVGCGANSVSPAKACADVATARCNKRASCTSAGNASGAGIVREFGDLTTCITRETLACMDGLAAKSTGNSPAEVEQCVPTYASLSCADFLAGNIQAPCVATGTLADGTACAFAGQCKSTYCINASHSACGTCGTPPALGADCSNSTCGRGVDCVTLQSTSTPAPQQCTAYGASGGDCDRDHPCGFGLSCVGANAKMMVMGKCMAAPTTAGAACDPTQQTAPGCERQAGLFCNTMSKTCTALAFGNDGDTCGVGSDGNFTDCKQGDCIGFTLGAMAMPGQCKAKAAEGDGCDTTFGPFCLAPAKCVTTNGTAGTCTLADGNMC
jgi:hypothetical protein